MVERRGSISALLYWATERENMRLSKEAGSPPPWTTDPILQKYRFCNVRRRDDRVSRWLIKNVLVDQPKYKNTMTFIKVVALCRWVNWPPTIQYIREQELYGTEGIDLASIGKAIDGKVTTGDKSWTGAYMVRAPSKKKYPGIRKGTFVAETVVGALDNVRQPLMLAIVANQTQLIWETICSVPNWGSFMAGQLVADLTYTPLLSEASDLLTWAPQGPGSRRGFNRMMGRDLYAKISNEEWLGRLQEWRGKVADATGLGDSFNLMDLQNCLCETDKMLRVRSGQGRPRSTYKPETAY